MKRYITMTMLAVVLLVWLLITMAPWIIVGPRRLAKRCAPPIGWFLLDALAWMALFGFAVVSLLLMVTWVVAGPWILAKRLRGRT